MENGPTHDVNPVTEKRWITTFIHQHNADQKKRKKTKHFVHSVASRKHATCFAGTTFETPDTMIAGAINLNTPNKVIRDITVSSEAMTRMIRTNVNGQNAVRLARS